MHPPAIPPAHSRIVTAHKRRGFTLMELLAVMGVMIVLAGVSIPVFSGLGGAADLTSAGLEVEGVFVTARQNAIAKRTPTAVAILKSPVKEGAFRALATFELVPGTGNPPGVWQQITDWKTLPNGVVINAAISDSNFLSQSPALSPAMSEVRYRNTVYRPGTDFSYQIFLPSGRLKSPPSPCNLTLVRGYYEGATLNPTGPSANYYSLLFVDATGEAKITRP